LNVEKGQVRNSRTFEMGSSTEPPESRHYQNVRLICLTSPLTKGIGRKFSRGGNGKKTKN